MFGKKWKSDQAIVNANKLFRSDKSIIFPFILLQLSIFAFFYVIVLSDQAKISDSSLVFGFFGSFCLIFFFNAMCYVRLKYAYSKQNYSFFNLLANSFSVLFKSLILYIIASLLFGAFYFSLLGAITRPILGIFGIFILFPLFAIFVFSQFYFMPLIAIEELSLFKAIKRSFYLFGKNKGYTLVCHLLFNFFVGVIYRGFDYFLTLPATPFFLIGALSAFLPMYAYSLKVEAWAIVKSE